jgi:methionyl-tRNA synthetase
MSKQRQLLVTTALPYANGSIHLGHMVEHIQADIWVRLQKSLGHDVVFLCGDDAHGTPIMISAEKQHITPDQLVAKIHAEHQQDFADFNVSFDNFYTTHSPENKMMAETIYQRLYDRGDIEVRSISQLYDPVKNMFLPDRYVKGECPRCSAKDQYGDNCEACGATYSPAELKNPVSILSGETPVEKQSEHYFFNLANYQSLLQDWLKAGHLQSAVSNKLLEWFADGLSPWDISRDSPYFGFEIPGAPGKYFYVWLDAPIGYMASFINLSERRKNLNFDHYWVDKNATELYHFVGKDIIYFHALFWPAMLDGSGHRMPTNVFAHGFLTINGQKMSKSRGTFITARHYLNHLNPDYLRYYFAAKLGNGIDDIDFNFDDFVQRVNSDLVGKVVNIASRCAGFITKNFAGKLAAQFENTELFSLAINQSDKIADLLTQREYSQAIREIMAIADTANQYIAEQAPWELAKQPGQEARVQAVCTLGINLFKIIMTYLQPIVPALAVKARDFLNCDDLSWQTLNSPLLDHDINPFIPMITRIDPQLVANILAEQPTVSA